MNKRFSTLLGAVLILTGGLMLSTNLVFPLLDIRWWHWAPWRLWPLMVVGVGVLCVITPFLMRGRRSLGGLFIPGVPVLVTGGILLFASTFDVWSAWAWLWPLEVLGLAAGFLFAALALRNVWLLVPAIIVGANGLLMQFCTLTGWWGVWAVLWTIEPLSVGLALLAVFLKRRSPGLLIAGSILCGVAAFGLIGMTALVSFAEIVPGWRVLSLIGPVVLVGIGVLLLIANVARRPELREAGAE